MFHSEYQIKRDELAALIEYMGAKDKLGKTVMEEKIFPVFGMEKGEGDLLHHHKPYDNFLFSEDQHEEIWDNLRKGSRFQSCYNRH